MPAGAFSAGVLLAETNYRTQVQHHCHLLHICVTKQDSIKQWGSSDSQQNHGV